MMEWFRWFEGSTNDPKFMVVARRSGQPVAFVLAVWAMLLERASAATPRGNIDGFDCESADALLGMPDGAACTIVEAMQAKSLIDGERVCKWEERQPSRERTPEAPGSSTQRSRECRQRKKRQETASYDAQRPCNDMQRAATTGNSLEEIREDKKRQEDHPPQDIPGYEDGAGENAGGGDGEYAESPNAENAPRIEFQELRLYYNAHGRQEAPKTGWQEYLTLHATRQWPGQSAIYAAIDRLSTQDGPWLAGKAPGLAKFLREQWWRMPPRSTARASPLAPPGQTVTERNEATAMQVLAEMEAENGY